MSMSGQVNPQLGTYSFNPAAAGRKMYGGGASFAPTQGPNDPTGYVLRSQQNAAKRQAYQRWLAQRSAGKIATGPSVSPTQLGQAQ